MRGVEHIFDVVVVGGGIMGSATAYYLLQLEPTLKIAVIEKDPSFCHSSTTLSLANFRIQFGLKENIQISQYGMEMLKDFDETMAVSGEVPGISFRQEGNLFLWHDEQETEARRSCELQREMGGNTRWLDHSGVTGLIPHYTGEIFEYGTHTSLDGFVDPYGMLMGYRKKSRSLGAILVTDEVVGISGEAEKKWMVKLQKGDLLETETVVNCAGAWAPEICRMAGIRIPVEPVNRQVFVVGTRELYKQPFPLTVLPSGLYFRSETPDTLLVGKSLNDDTVGYSFETEDNRFHHHLWPELVTLVPSFDRLKLRRSWAGLYGVNRLDGNAILGEWPGSHGFFISAGFSGHGLQQAPAVGRYLGELILKKPMSLDLSIFSPERILSSTPITETNLV